MALTSQCSIRSSIIPHIDVVHLFIYAKAGGHFCELQIAMLQNIGHRHDLFSACSTAPSLPCRLVRFDLRAFTHSISSLLVILSPLARTMRNSSAHARAFCIFHIPKFLSFALVQPSLKCQHSSSILLCKTPAAPVPAHAY